MLTLQTCKSLDKYFKNMHKHAFVSKSLKVKYVFVGVFKRTYVYITKNMIVRFYKIQLGLRKTNTFL